MFVARSFPMFSLLQLHTHAHTRRRSAGHSLGGALATLAALGIRQACPTDMVDVSCYTFGAPRTGNHAFAREYNAAVPDTWSIINDQVSFIALASCQWQLCLRVPALEVAVPRSALIDSSHS